MAEHLGPGEYVANIRAQVGSLISGIGQLAKAELVPAAKHAGIGGGMFGAAGVFVIGALNILLLTAGFALAVFYQNVVHRQPLTALALGFLTLAVLALIIAVVLGVIGRSQVRKVKAPTATIEEAKASLNAIGESVQAGIAQAKQIPTDTHEPAVGTGAWLAQSQAARQQQLPQ